MLDLAYEIEGSALTVRCRKLSMACERATSAGFNLQRNTYGLNAHLRGKVAARAVLNKS